MHNSIKGALWSGLVFPGMGQVVLKHYQRGALIIIAISVCMAVLVMQAVEQALAVLENLDLEGGAISMRTITDTATRASANSGSTSYNLLLLLITGCWLISVVDAYLLGRRKDLEQRARSSKW